MPHPLSPFVVLLEKVLSTYVQAFVAFLLVGGTINASTAQIAVIAAIPAALTVIANGVPVVPLGLPFYVDLVLRALRTYVVSFVGVLVAVPVFHLDAAGARAAAISALPAALALIKGALASKVGNPDSAALLPAHLDVSTPLAAA